ncbi:ankyrin repeat domain-containing protein [Planctomycetota bacterium]
MRIMLTIVWLASFCSCKSPSDWEAAEYFRDSKVVELCEAIRDDDFPAAKKLIDGGVKANTIGRDNMTPLLWAFRYKRMATFELLLRNGADPNINFRSEFGFTRENNDSVVHLAAYAPEYEYLELVMKYGGDANLAGRNQGSTPIFCVRSGDRHLDRIRLLLKKGANVNYVNRVRQTPLHFAINRYAKYDIALLLLESGADPLHLDGFNNAIHRMVTQRKELKTGWTPTRLANYAKVIAWLEEHGYSIKEAKDDIARRDAWEPSYPIAAHSRRRREEIKLQEERRARFEKQREAGQRDQGMKNTPPAKPTDANPIENTNRRPVARESVPKKDEREKRGQRNSKEMSLKMSLPKQQRTCNVV